MFPQWDEAHPARVTPARPWRPSPDQRELLAVLVRPMDVTELWETLGHRLKMGTVENHIETLARRGFVRDSGERTAWTSKGRRWRYERTEEKE